MFEQSLILVEVFLGVSDCLLIDLFLVEKALDVRPMEPHYVFVPLELCERKIKNTFGMTCILSYVWINHFSTNVFFFTPFTAHFLHLFKCFIFFKHFALDWRIILSWSFEFAVNLVSFSDWSFLSQSIICFNLWLLSENVSWSISCALVLVFVVYLALLYFFFALLNVLCQLLGSHRLGQSIKVILERSECFVMHSR